MVNFSLILPTEDFAFNLTTFFEGRPTRPVTFVAPAALSFSFTLGAPVDFLALAAVAFFPFVFRPTEDEEDFPLSWDLVE